MSAIAPIAIVGRGCVLPGALDPDALWRLVVEGRDALGAAPQGRWRVPMERVLTADPAESADRAWSDRGGYVRGFEEAFDPRGFALAPDRLQGLDPLYRWTLHAGREAFREARLERGRRGGVILGNLSFPTAGHAAYAERRWLDPRSGAGASSAPSGDPLERFHSGLPARLLAASLGLDDVGSYCLDAACASSLYAIALACEALTDRRADVMIAGAVNCTDDLFIHVGFCALSALSKTGQSRPFHPDADGLVPGEGAAVVALMRLDDAVAEGRPILGVIRGVGLANDGRARGFLAPAEEGQRRAMRRAYDAAGLRPADVAWIECHATGTPVGDATEVRSASAIFAGCADVPIGSLKANVGHLITTAGAAGLLKVLGALEAGVRPPTPHLDRVSDALRDTPLRVVREPERWTGPGRAAVSAFGFGGNDAHLIVEAHDETSRGPRPIPAPVRLEPLAIVGIGARVGPFDSAEAFADALATGRGGRRASEVTLPLERLKTPPSDLRAALAQQTMIAAAALDAVPDALDPSRTAVLIGMQCDSEVARYGVRWRLPPEDPRRDLFAPPLEAAGVLGTMPNIPANRLNAQLDARGPSFTVSADELSGVRALSIAARALRAGDVDHAIVGAVDMACEPVHEHASGSLCEDDAAAREEDARRGGADEDGLTIARDARHRRGGDAAVVLVVERLADARAAGRSVLAILDDQAPASGGDTLRLDGRELSPQLGHAHAASGLLHVAAAALCLHRRARFGERPGDWAADDERRARIRVDALGGSRADVLLREDVRTPAGAVSLIGPPPRRALTLPAHPPAAPGPDTDARPRAPRLPAAAGWRVTPTASDAAARMDPPPALPPVIAVGPSPASPSSAPSDGGAASNARWRANGGAASPPEHFDARPSPLAPFYAPSSPAPAPSPARSAPATPQGAIHAPLHGAAVSADAPFAAQAARPAGEPGPAPADPLLAAIAEQHRRVVDSHRRFVDGQSHLHRAFLRASARAAEAVLPSDAGRREQAQAERAPDRRTPTLRGGPGSGSVVQRTLDSDLGGSVAESTTVPESSWASPATPSPVSPSVPTASPESPAPSAPAASSVSVASPVSAGSSAVAVSSSLSAASPLSRSASARSSRGLSPATPPPSPSGPTFDRAALEVHASGRISEIFGAAFEAQDEHAVQVRMPEPPLLLSDRVTGLTGEPTTMGKGSVWTETDVTDDAWYLHRGRMPAGLMIESGQADLFLISWLGADLLNRGERSYRLLGCKLTWHRSPPKVGETLAYDIHVDGHARQGDVRLFFFHYDCHVGGRPALTVRDGQAGFFTTAELDASAGVLWSPEEHTPDPHARVDPPAVKVERRAFDDAHLQALAAGDVVGCFGAAFEPTRAHVRTPTIAAGDMRFLERVVDFDPRGGPWGRGYLKAVTRIHPDDWYFAGHFKNDPCMPGTLMLEGCLQAMAFHLVGLGYTLDRDGWRFEPITDETYEMVCRGQVVPSSRELTYELFVEEVHDGPTPKLYADLLCTVDGLKAFHARRFGFTLVPDAPLSSRAELLGGDDPEPVAELDGVKLGRAALLHSALGAPSAAFGPTYALFDGVRRAPRLPAPPYHMVSRVTSVDGAPWQKKAGPSVEIAYDVPPDAWYFEDGGSGAMPFALSMEAALQPCGWLATYVGSTLGRDEDLRFRNLDGEGEILADVPPNAGTLRTRATLTSMTDTAAMVIVGFEVVTRLGDVDVYRLKTVFGFFPDAAFEGQAGLPVDESSRALLRAMGRPVKLQDRPALFDGGARLSDGRLRLLDEIPFFDPRGGRAGLGAARGERDVDAGDWYFRAHFFEDPVQPGSLGVEAMLQLLRFVVLEKGLAAEMLSPRFTPIAPGAHRWKYRGQVRPSDGRVAVTLEVTSIDARRAEVLAHADCSLWIDGKRIYEATVGVRLVDDAAPSRSEGGGEAPRDGEPGNDRLLASSVHSGEPGAETGRGWPRDGRVDAQTIALAWRAHLGVGPWLGEDLILSLVDRFVGRVRAVDVEALDRLRGRPALYLANHQTAIETLMLSVVAGAYGGVPIVTVAKAEHARSWYGELLAWLFRYPGVRLEELTAYFDRDDPAALPALLRRIAGDRSILLHVEGTRATRCGQAIERLSGVPIDVAEERGLAIVPVRFTGGLPVAPVTEKLDFPVGMTRQDIWLGAPVEPSALPRTYAERVAVVRRAIDSLGPADEAPNPPDPRFARRVDAAAERLGMQVPHAVLLEALRDAHSPTDTTRRLVSVLDGSPLAIDGARAEDRWLARWSARLFD